MSTKLSLPEIDKQLRKEQIEKEKLLKEKALLNNQTIKK
jgi:hypothetical protein